MLNLKVQGRFRYIVEDPNGVVVEESGWIKNLITDFGLEYLSTNGANKNIGIAIGTGSKIAEHSDLSLAERLATSQYTTSEVSNNYKTVSGWTSGDFHLTGVRAFKFSDFKSGQNITEVGLGYEYGGTFRAITRANIKDAHGVLTAVSVPAGYALTVIYELIQIVSTERVDYELEYDIQTGKTTKNAYVMSALVGVDVYDKGDHVFRPFEIIYNPTFNDGLQTDPTTTPTIRTTWSLAYSFTLDNYSLADGATYTLKIPADSYTTNANPMSLRVDTTRGYWTLNFPDSLEEKTRREVLELTFNIKLTRED